MKTSRKFMLFFAVFALALVIISCSSAGETTAPEEETSTDTTTSEESVSSEESSSTDQEEAPASEGGITLPSIASCETEVCTFSGIFVLEHPVDTGDKNAIDPTSRFGSYRASTDSASRGVYYPVSKGTSVLAAADGKVVVAGDDSQTSYGRDTNTYGSLVILEHQIAGLSEPLFTLYGYLSEVSVEVDAMVNVGDEIGKVGDFIGASALIFEVRVGQNDISSLGNPELWLKPVGRNAGALAGRIVDPSGNFIEIENIVVEQLGSDGQSVVKTQYLQAYTHPDLAGLPPFEENFGISDLPPGQYTVTIFVTKSYKYQVEITPGEVTYLTITVE